MTKPFNPLHQTSAEPPFLLLVLAGILGAGLFYLFTLVFLSLG